MKWFPSAQVYKILSTTKTHVPQMEYFVLNLSLFFHCLNLSRYLSLSIRYFTFELNKFPCWIHLFFRTIGISFNSTLFDQIIYLFFLSNTKNTIFFLLQFQFDFAVLLMKVNDNLSLTGLFTKKKNKTKYLCFWSYLYGPEILFEFLNKSKQKTVKHLFRARSKVTKYLCVWFWLYTHFWSLKYR